MSRNQTDAFAKAAQSVDAAIDLTIKSINTHGPKHRHWVIAWSGGKDSTMVLTVIIHLLKAGKIDPPDSLTVLYADTRMELPPLAISAQYIMNQIRNITDFPCRLGVESVCAPIDKRFFVYMLGRGVPPPNNKTLRWCTVALKVAPMQHRVEDLFHEVGEKPLMITGVRRGESAARDGRIAISCSKDNSECGQGWYQAEMPEGLVSTLAPADHWRVCNVWDWLAFYAPNHEYGGWDTSLLAEAYGGDQAVENQARTGCNGCPLTDKDTALDGVLRLYPESWGHLKPLYKLRPIYREMRRARYRLRQSGEKKKNGSYSANPNRMGPLYISARRYFLSRIISVQDEINQLAARSGREPVDMLNEEEIYRIKELQQANTWPNGWTGKEPVATQIHDTVFSDGSIQKNIFLNQPSLV